MDTMQRVARILRDIEKVAPTIDRDTPYEERDTIPDFYAYCLAQRGYGVAVSVLRHFVSREMGVSEGTASRLIVQARAEGLIERDGNGSDTRYYTPQYAQEVEGQAREQDRNLISLGARAVGLGLRVAYNTDRWDGGRSHEEMVRLVREGTEHVRSVHLAMGLEGLVEAMEHAGVSL